MTTVTGDRTDPDPPRGGEESGAAKGLSFLGRCGLAGRTGFYVILAAITVRIAVLGGAHSPQANAHGALALVSRPLIGKVAIGAVALGFFMFGVGRLVGAVQDRSVSGGRRVLTALQGLFYLALAYIPASYLGGNTQTGSQQQQTKTTADLLSLPGGRALVIVLGAVMVLVCGQQIRGALARDFRDGLDLGGAPGLVRRVVDKAGVIGITARALVFLPVGVFLIVAAFESKPTRSYGTDSELLALSGHIWGQVILAVVAGGLATFVVFSVIETRYRQVISAR